MEKKSRYYFLFEVVSLIRNPENKTEYLIQDQTGRFLLYDSKKRVISEQVLNFHQGEVNSISSSPVNHYLVSIGQDSTIKIHDYVRKAFVSSTKLNIMGTVLQHFPKVFQI